MESQITPSHLTLSDLEGQSQGHSDVKALYLVDLFILFISFIVRKSTYTAEKKVLKTHNKKHQSTILVTAQNTAHINHFFFAYM